MKSKLLRFGIVSLLIASVCGTTLCFAPDIIAKLTYASEHGQALAAREQLEATPASGAVDFRQVAKAIAPSVVNISTVTKVPLGPQFGPQMQRPELFQGPLHDFFSDDFFHRFFGPTPRRQQQAEQRSLGTGVIVTEDGYILTNNHVIRGADEVTVNLSDGRNLTAEVVGSDAKTDLAVLKVDANKLLPAELDDSENIEVGEWVLAVGNPFGLRNTFTSGIVSAKGRSDMGIARYEDFIQTDAAINPGNSGGPLVNMSGKVIGINTAIASRSGGYQGIGFAIPSAMAREVMDSLIKDGRVVRGWLGVYIQDLNEALAESFGLENADGVLVAQVVEGGPAEEAGLQSGDIVVSINGKTVKTAKSFSSAVATLDPGAKTCLTVFRDGQKQELEAQISNYPDDEDTLRSPSAGNLGLSLKTLTPDLATRYGIKSGAGVLVTGVEPGSLASRGGLRQGDVIVSVNGEDVISVSEFHSAVKKRGVSDGVRILVESKGHRRFLILQEKS